MNKEQQPSRDKEEEVDLIVFFNFIGNKIDRLLSSLLRFFKSVFSIFIYLLRFFFQSWKIFLLTIGAAYIVGYFLEKNIEPSYDAKMLVEPYFDSKYQLVSSINYFNALISNKDYEALGTLFKLDKQSLLSIKGFKIEPGPETENDRLLQYLEFKNKLTKVNSLENNSTEENAEIISSNSIDIKFDDFIENRSIYAGRYFQITANSTKDDVFESLEKGIFNSFRNSYSTKVMTRDSLLIGIQKKNILDQLKKIDSLKTIYIDVLKDNYRKENSNVKIGDKEIAFSSDSQKTREYELLSQELMLKDKLELLDLELVRKDGFFDVIAGFQKVGNLTSHWSQQYRLILPTLAFILLCGFFFFRKLITFTLNYEK